MLPNIFFNDRFEKLINELGILHFESAFNLQELFSIRDAAKGFILGNPHEAATRAFRDLVILNERIPVELRLDAYFEKLAQLVTWYALGDVNVDLHFGARADAERVLTEYAGKDFQINYFNALTKLGVVVPIENDFLRTAALAYLFKGKKSGMQSSDTALSFCVNVISKNKEKYASSISKDGLCIPKAANSPKIEQLLQHARNGDVGSQFVLASAYEEGLLVE